MQKRRSIRKAVLHGLREMLARACSRSGIIISAHVSCVVTVTSVLCGGAAKKAKSLKRRRRAQACAMRRRNVLRSCRNTREVNVLKLVMIACK